MEQECPIEGCDATIPLSMLMCKKHWYQVPKEQRDDVWAAWKARQAREEGSMQRHDEAKAAAIASVEAA